MAGRKITKEMWEALLSSFREDPGNASKAARAAGCERRLAKRAWENGFPLLRKAKPHPDAHRPFRDIIHDEQEEVRARLREREKLEAAKAPREQAKKDQAKEDALTQKEREGFLVRSAQNNAMGLLAVVGELARASIPLAQKLGRTIEFSTRPVEQGGDPENKLDVQATTQLLARLAYIGQTAIGAAKTSMEMERKLLGDPDETTPKTGRPKVDEERALRLMGGDEERLQQAIRDLIAGNITADAAIIVESVERAPQMAPTAH